MAGREDRARLFIALDPPAAVCEELIAWARSAAASAALGGSRGALRVLDQSLLHLTICFLGQRPVHEIHGIEEALADFDGSAGELSLGAPVWLPPRRPRALAVEVAETQPGLGELRKRLLEALPVELEAGRFRPHVTVARMPAPAAPPRRELPATPALRFLAPELVLYRSWLSPAGPRYEALASRELDLAR